MKIFINMKHENMKKQKTPRDHDDSFATNNKHINSARNLCFFLYEETQQ